MLRARAHRTLTRAVSQSTREGVDRAPARELASCATPEELGPGCYRVPDFPWVALVSCGSSACDRSGNGRFRARDLAGRRRAGARSVGRRRVPGVGGRSARRSCSLATGSWRRRCPCVCSSRSCCTSERGGCAELSRAAAAGHVTGSVIVAVGAGAVGWSGQPILVRAAQNMDYGELLHGHRGRARRARITDRRPAIPHPRGHDRRPRAAAPSPDGGLGAHRGRPHRLRDRPRPSPSTVARALRRSCRGDRRAHVVRARGRDATADTLRFGDTGASAASAPGQPHGTVAEFTYEAALLEHRPETAQVYVPPASAGPRPVIVFLHDLPGDSNDWLAGAAASQVLDEQARANVLPWSVAVFVLFDGFVDPAAGWSDVPGQRTLASAVHDLVPALARQFPDRVDPTSIAVVGVGRGADGGSRCCRDDRRVRDVVALDPTTGSNGQSGHRAVLLERTPGGGWHRWRSELPGALQWLGSQGFGATPHAQGTRT